MNTQEEKWFRESIYRTALITLGVDHTPQLDAFVDKVVSMCDVHARKAAIRTIEALEGKTKPSEYVAHLADDDDRRRTFCGKPWQGWQAPYGAPLKPTEPYQQPRYKHNEKIRLCQKCNKLSHEWAEKNL